MRRIADQAHHRWFGPPSFYKEAAFVMLPVMLQQMVSSLFNFVDNLMVGLVDAQTLAGVAVANKMYIIFIGLFMGVSGTGAVLISQFHGADDREQCEHIFALQAVVGLAIGFLFTVLLTIFPVQILGLFIQDPVTTQRGLEYISLIRFSYIPAALTMVCLFSLRAVGHNKMPLIAGFSAIVINIFLNWVFIFGHLGFPAWGARGAALATLIARLLEASAYLVWIGSRRTLFSWNLFSLRRLNGHVAWIALRKAIPLTLNEFLYTAGLSVIFWAYSRIDERAIPALVITDQTIQVMMIAFGGQATAIAIMVGKRLGAGQFDQARLNARLLLISHVLLAVVVSILMAVLAPVVPTLFAIPEDLRDLATRLILVQSIFFTGLVLYAHIFFVLRAGGDMRSAFLFDAGLMWVLPIPVIVAIASFWTDQAAARLPWVYLLVVAVQNLRIIPGLYFLRRGNWITNLAQYHRN